MGLLNDILTWTETLPSWQRDAARRLLMNESGLSASDYSELYALLKKENGIAVDSELTACPLAAERLPAETIAGDNVLLLALRELKHVNRIPSDHALKFAVYCPTMFPWFPRRFTRIFTARVRVGARSRHALIMID